MTDLEEVKVGQRWMDCDKRMSGRICQVIAVHEHWAVLAQLRLRPTVVALKNMYPHATGWKLMR